MKRVGIDVGGTFTDLIVYDEETKQLSREKVLSTPHAPELGVLDAASAAAIRPEDLSYLIHGTTIVTNIIIERNGAKVGLITTAGFEDVLEIMRASRPRPYDLDWVKQEPIVPRHLRLGVTERMDYQGNVLTPLCVEEATQAVLTLLEHGVEAIAVCFLHSYANSEHEVQMAEIIRRLSPTVHISISSDVCREIREYERTSTVTLNAYAMPGLRQYVQSLERELPIAGGIRYMNSEGGIIPVEEVTRSPVSLALSGPAAGVLAGQFLGRTLGLDNLITMDMGGTSLDVCVIMGGEPQRDSSLSVEWGIPIRMPAVQIATVGAGGGSIVWIDEGNALQIGPESAGAFPGPACYGRGGQQATVTDANMVLGLLNPDYFLGGQFQVDGAKAREVIQPIANHYNTSLEKAAEGIYRVANAKMAQAIRQITVEKGIDPRTFILISFGGAGGQHAVAVAREAAIKQVIIPVSPSVFSALGMITADVRASRSRTLMRPLTAITVDELDALFRELEAEARPVVAGGSEEVTVARTVELRYQSQSHELAVPLLAGDTPSSLYERFEALHYQLYGSRLGDPLDVITLRSTVIRHIQPIELPASANGQASLRPQAAFQRRVYPYQQPLPVFRRSDLAYGMVLPSPCIVEEVDTTHFLPAGCSARIDQFANIVIDLD